MPRINMTILLRINDVSVLVFLPVVFVIRSCGNLVDISK
jgi:hypothetical protein